MVEDSKISPHYSVGDGRFSCTATCVVSHEKALAWNNLCASIIKCLSFVCWILLPGHCIGISSND